MPYSSTRANFSSGHRTCTPTGIAVGSYVLISPDNNNMKDMILRARHWQLFILSFGIPFVLQLIMIGRIMLKVFNNEAIPPSGLFSESIVLIIIAAILYAIHPLWIWSVAVSLQDKVPETIKLKIKKFKIFFIIPLVYFILYLTLFSPAIINFEVDPTLFLLIMPLHFFAMFCILYCLYFSAKTFRTVELQRTVHSGDYIGEFFLIWLFPIGVWIIQPRLNKIVQQL